MSKHTPGPWTPNHYAFMAGGKLRWWQVLAQGGEVQVSDMGDCGLPPDEAEANANLIAAAPDLLEAAKHAATEWRLHGQLTDSCRVLEAAIAKARGK